MCVKEPWVGPGIHWVLGSSAVPLSDSLSASEEQVTQDSPRETGCARLSPWGTWMPCWLAVSLLKDFQRPVGGGSRVTGRLSQGQLPTAGHSLALTILRADLVAM